MEDATDNLLVLQNSASNQFVLFCYGTLLSQGLITSRLCSRSRKCCLSTFVGVWSELYDNIFHLTVRFQLNYHMAWSRYHFHLVYVYISLHAKCCIFEYDALNGCTFMFIGPGSSRCTKIKTKKYLFNYSHGLKLKNSSHLNVPEINNIEVAEDRTQPGGFYEVRLTVGL